MEIKLTEQARRVAHAADSKGRERRIALTTLHFGDGEIAASDGYMLAVRKVGGIDNDIMLPAKAILDSKDIGKEFPHILVTLPDGDGAATLITKDFVRSEVKQVAGTFPRYNQLWPTTPVQATISLSPTLLKKLLAIAGKNTVMIDLEIHSPTEPVKYTCFTGEGNDTTGLIMQMHHLRKTANKGERR